MSTYFLDFKIFMREIRKWSFTGEGLYKVKLEERKEFFFFSFTLPNGEEYLSSIDRNDISVLEMNDLLPITMMGKRVDDNLDTAKMITAKLEEVRNANNTIRNKR